MNNETAGSVGLLRCGIYLFTILAVFPPLVLIAMSGAFAGGADGFYINTTICLGVVAISMLAVGLSSLISGRALPRWIASSGPIAACIFLGSLQLGWLQGKIGKSVAVLPLLVLSFTAICLDLFAMRASQDS